MINRVLAIALNTFRENRRDRVLYVLLFFAAALIVGGVGLGELSPFEQSKILLDLGQAAMFLVGSLIAILLGNGLISKEIERRTVSSILSKPVSRAEFLVGKVIGLNLTITTALAIMAVTLVGVVLAYGSTPTLALIQSFVFLWSEMVLLVALAVAFASFVSSSTLAGMFSLSCWVLGQVTADLERIATRSSNVATRTILLTFHWVLPDLSLFDAKARGTHGVIVPMEEFVAVLLYGLAYTVLLLALASAAFSRRDFK